MRFVIDVSNPDEVSAKLPELRTLYEEKLREQKALNSQVELLRRLLDQASVMSRGRLYEDAGDAEPERLTRRRRTAPAQDRAVKALEQASRELAGTALGPTSLYKFMVAKGMDVPGNATVLGTNLWDAWKAGRVMRAPNGVYTPLDGTGRTQWDQPLTDYYFAAEQGFPVPAG